MVGGSVEEPIVSQKPDAIPKEKYLTKWGQLEAILEKNPQFGRTISSRNTSQPVLGHFIYSEGGMRALFYINCNTVLVKREDPESNTLTIESYIVRDDNEILPVHSSTFNLEKGDHKKLEAARLFRHLRDVTEWGNISNCPWFEETQKGLVMNIDGYNLELLPSYEGMSVMEMFPYYQGVTGAMDSVKFKKNSISYLPVTMISILLLLSSTAICSIWKDIIPILILAGETEKSTA